jgi:hypothetical protein
MDELKESLLELLKYTGIQLPPNDPLDVLNFLKRLKELHILSTQEIDAITERIRG